MDRRSYVTNAEFRSGDKVELLVPFASGSTFADAGTICTVRYANIFGFISVVGPDRHIWLCKPGEIKKRA